MAGNRAEHQPSSSRPGWPAALVLAGFDAARDGPAKATQGFAHPERTRRRRPPRRPAPPPAAAPTTEAPTTTPAPTTAEPGGRPLRPDTAPRLREGAQVEALPAPPPRSFLATRSRRGRTTGSTPRPTARSSPSRRWTRPRPQRASSAPSPARTLSAPRIPQPRSTTAGCPRRGQLLHPAGRLCSVTSDGKMIEILDALLDLSPGLRRQRRRRPRLAVTPQGSFVDPAPRSTPRTAADLASSPPTLLHRRLRPPRRLFERRRSRPATAPSASPPPPWTAAFAKLPVGTARSRSTGRERQTPTAVPQEPVGERSRCDLPGVVGAEVGHREGVTHAAASCPCHARPRAPAGPVPTAAQAEGASAATISGGGPGGLPAAHRPAGDGEPGTGPAWPTWPRRPACSPSCSRTARAESWPRPPPASAGPATPSPGPSPRRRHRGQGPPVRLAVRGRRPHQLHAPRPAGPRRHHQGRLVPVHRHPPPDLYRPRPPRPPTPRRPAQPTPAPAAPAQPTPAPGAPATPAANPAPALWPRIALGVGLLLALAAGGALLLRRRSTPAPPPPADRGLSDPGARSGRARCRRGRGTGPSGPRAGRREAR